MGSCARTRQIGGKDLATGDRLCGCRGCADRDRFHGGGIDLRRRSAILLNRKQFEQLREWMLHILHLEGDLLEELSAKRG